MKIFTNTLIILFFLTLNCCVNFGSNRQLNHQVKKRDDGGFTIVINGTIQHFIPITAEGFFPKEPVNYRVELIGKGKDWSYRNQPGFYYSYPDSIKGELSSWDIGYAWVDEKKENIYLNFYWIASPDSLAKSKINGKYKITK